MPGFFQSESLILIAHDINVNMERDDVNVAGEIMNRSWSAFKFISLMNWLESYSLYIPCTSSFHKLDFSCNKFPLQY